jgi:hypothetical protein
MPRFSIKDLLIATTCIAMGIGLLAFPYYHHEYISANLPSSTYVLCWFGGGALIGAGILNPFGRPLWGAAIGFVVLVLVPVAFLWAGYL